MAFQRAEREEQRWPGPAHPPVGGMRAGWDEATESTREELSGGQGQRRGGGKNQGCCLRSECV